MNPKENLLSRKGIEVHKRRMPSSAMWRSVGLLQTGISEQRVASIFRVQEITRARKRVRRLLTENLKSFTNAIAQLHKVGFTLVKYKETQSSRVLYDSNIKIAQWQSFHYYEYTHIKNVVSPLKANAQCRFTKRTAFKTLHYKSITGAA
jgi:hypothetical protein